MAILETKNLSYIYGEKTPYRKDAVRNVSLSFEKGELVGIIGHTGSGKSTLVQCLNGLLKPTAGSVLFEGEDVHTDAKSIRELRFKVGLVFQYPEYQLFDNTVFDDIAYGPKNMGMSEDEIKNTVYAAAQVVGLDKSNMDRSPFDLSGGQKRRAAIAGVIAMRPQVLILDEPTAGLDPIGRKQIFDMILSYREQTGSTVIIVSHSMEDIARYADRVIVMNDGRVQSFDKTEEVFRSADELVAAGLDVPQITRVFMKLREMGFSLPQGVYSVDAAVTAILDFKRNRTEGDNA